MEKILDQLITEFEDEYNNHGYADEYEAWRDGLILKYANKLIDREVKQDEKKIKAFMKFIVEPKI